MLELIHVNIIKTVRISFLVIFLMMIPINIVFAQNDDNYWKNAKGEVVFSYSISCSGPIYPGAAFNRWEVCIKNVVKKDVKCEVSIVKDEHQEVSEAITLEIPAKHEKSIVFLRVDIDCSQHGNLYFNRTSYKKSKTL